VNHLSLLFITVEDERENPCRGLDEALLIEVFFLKKKDSRVRFSGSKYLGQVLGNEKNF
jgi:hypothetical protein